MRIGLQLKDMDDMEISELKKIAVLMTCYNRVQTTLECLRRLFALNMPAGYSFDIWLVDDASPDMTGEKVKFAYPQVHVINGVGNLFWSKGMRLAWDKAAEAWDYDFYLWLNDDVMLNADALGVMLGDFARLGGVIVGKFSSDETEADVSYSLKGRYMSGNFVLVPQEVYRKVGKIYGGYHHQYGDYDYGLHVLKTGIPLNATNQFCGICPQQPERYKNLNGLGVVARLRTLLDPRGFDLHDAVVYKYRNWGIIRATLSMVHVIMSVMFYPLWNSSKSDEVPV